MEELYKNFKSGFVSIVGRPNVGKSTLMNAVMGEKLSIISPKPQTTRQSVKGIFTDTTKQIVFLDTPGFLQPRYELQVKMMEYITTSMKDSDVLIFMTDIRSFPTDYDDLVLAMLAKIRKPKIALLNKTDLATPGMIEEKTELLKKHDFEEIMAISALEMKDRSYILDSVGKFLPYGAPFYAPDEVSDMPMRFFVKEIVREQIFLNYKDEIPYSSTVTVEQYKDYPNKVEISANIWLERKSQKPILIGKGGAGIKNIRINSEKEIHKLLEKRVKLELWVKIKDKWRKKKNAIKEFGY